MPDQPSHTAATATLRRACLLGALALLCTLAACGPGDKFVESGEAMPPGAVEAAAPAAFVAGMQKVKVSDMWLKGFKSDDGWQKAIDHVDQVAAKYGYHKAPTPAVPNIDRLGLTKEDIYQFWLSPSGKYGLGLMNFQMMRQHGASFDGDADFLVFCGGGSMAQGQ
jgi:hypothetical protein